MNTQNGYVMDGLAPRESPGRGRGLFTLKSFRPGDVIAAFGGTVVDWDGLKQLGEHARGRTIQIEEGLYLYSEREGPADWVNHSCAPNVGLSGQVVLVAMRPISKGEEVCFDYAMSDGSEYDEFPCRCGARSCRSWVGGADWMRPRLQRKYAGYFSPYLERRILELRASGTVSRTR